MIVLKLVQVSCVCVQHSTVLSFADGSCTRHKILFLGTLNSSAPGFSPLSSNSSF
jgi:hypothetical protein